MTKTLKVVFLCAGNTCRSPLAAALARRRCGAAAGDFVSAGLHAVCGEPASDGAVLVAAEHGVDLTAHRSRPVDEALLAEAQWVVAMTRGQVARLKARFPGYRGRVGLLGLPGMDLSAEHDVVGGEDVADPFGGSPADYRRMSDQVARLIDAWRTVFAAAAQPAPKETP